ncbi:MAG: hypothetical protein P1V20_05930 [Verrucomicrobiales bacterium]|nr:hypothetical protein [Verrucomicrobiales bacterium]
MPLPPKIKAGCGAATLFFAGVLCGIIGVFVLLALIIPRSEGWEKEDSRQFLAKHFSKRLKLTEEQKEKLTPGFNEFLNQRWALRSGYIKADRKILEDYLKSVEPELSPDQVKRSKEVMDHWWKEKRKLIGE